jgi:acetyltransferase-like isoleucine patch superfamily enzyme
MEFLISFLRRIMYSWELRKRFPLCVIHPGATADRYSMLGNNSVLFRRARIIASKLGAYSYVQENSTLSHVQVGPYSSIAANVSIGLVNHPMDFISTSPVFYDNTQPLPRFLCMGNCTSHEYPLTVIGPDVWIGEGVKIMAGVNIGVGAVIGSGSVVTKDIPPYTISAGIPCRKLRRRFDDALCHQLEQSLWWELPEETLVALGARFKNPVTFLDALKEMK